MNDNPFDVLGLSPQLDTRSITTVLQRRAETATGDEREALQKAWRALTMKEKERVRHAFFAHPKASDDDHMSTRELRERAAAPLVRLRNRDLVTTPEDHQKEPLLRVDLPKKSDTP